MSSSPMYSKPAQGRPGRPRGIMPVAFTPEDDACLVQYMAESNVTLGKTGINYYITMTENLKHSTPWVLRHPPSAWQNRYSKNRIRFDEAVIGYRTNPRNFESGEGSSRLPESQERTVNGNGEDETEVGESGVDGAPVVRMGSEETVRQALAGLARYKINGKRAGPNVEEGPAAGPSRRPPRKRRKTKASTQAAEQDDLEARELLLYALSQLGNEHELSPEDVMRMYNDLGQSFVQTRQACIELVRIADHARGQISTTEVCDIWFLKDHDMAQTAEYFHGTNGHAINPDLE